MSLSDRLATPGPEDRQPRPRNAPAGWEPGIAWDGHQGAVTTGPMASPPETWDDLIRDWGLDPAEVMVVGDPQIRAWDANMGGGEVRRFRYYRMTIRKRAEHLDVDEIIKRVKRPKTPAKATGGELGFLVCSGDLQLGKPDGDGTQATVDRFLAKTEASRQRLRQLRRHKPIGALYLPWLGDCIEGTQSQGGRLVMRLELTPTEQVRLYRRLLLHQLEEFRTLAERIVVPVLPGNHDEAIRMGDQMATRYDDSWAIEGAAAVADALKLNEPAWSHVSFVMPQRDELTLTLDVAGTITGMLHGHQARAGKIMDWWGRQAHGMQPIGDATLLLHAHNHHLRVEQGGAKTAIQIPALDGGSVWWRHRTGQDAPPGMVTLTAGNGGWGDLAIL